MKAKKVLVEMVKALVGIGAGIGIGIKCFGKKEDSSDNKHYYYFQVLNTWLELRNKNHNLKEYFINNNYKTIAIYGGGNLGIRLWEELQGTEVEIKYVIDNSVCILEEMIDIYSLEDELEKVDVVVVTPIHAYESIKNSLTEKMDCEIVSLADVVSEIVKEK